MRHTSRLMFVLLVLLGAVGVLVSASVVHARTVTVGVVRDGDPAAEDIAAAIEAQVANLVPHDVEVRFKEAPSFNAGWDPARADDALESALADGQVDFVLTMGDLTSQEAARPERTLSKPVISAIAEFADLYDTPYDPDGGSLKRRGCRVACRSPAVVGRPAYGADLPADRTWTADLQPDRCAGRCAGCACIIQCGRDPATGETRGYQPE